MNLAPVFKQRFFDQNGAPLAGGLLYSYLAGTSTPQATYSNAAGATNANPVVLDSQGYADIWLDPTIAYKFVLKDSAGITQWTEDNVQIPSTGLAWASTQVYGAGDIVKDSSGLLYVSLLANNVGNPLTNVSAWRMFDGNVRTVSTNTTLAVTDNLVRSNSTSGALTHTLPALASTPIGKKITVRDIGTGGYSTAVKGSGTELIDGHNTYVIPLLAGTCATFQNTGSAWDVLGLPSLGQQMSASSGNSDSHSSATFVALTNLSVTITTTGRPVMIMLQPDGSANGAFIACNCSGGTSAAGVLALNNGSAYIAQWQLSTLAGNNGTSSLNIGVPLSLSFIDTPAAGTITYTLFGKATSGTTLVGAESYKLVAYEL